MPETPSYQCHQVIMVKPAADSIQDALVVMHGLASHASNHRMSMLPYAPAVSLLLAVSVHSSRHVILCRPLRERPSFEPKLLVAWCPGLEYMAENDESL